MPPPRGTIDRVSLPILPFPDDTSTLFSFPDIHGFLTRSLSRRDDHPEEHNDHWRKYYSGKSYRWILGTVLGTLGLLIVGLGVHLWLRRRRRSKRRLKANSYAHVVLPPARHPSVREPLLPPGIHYEPWRFSSLRREEPPIETSYGPVIGSVVSNLRTGSSTASTTLDATSPIADLRRKTTLVYLPPPSAIPEEFQETLDIGPSDQVPDLAADTPHFGNYASAVRPSLEIAPSFVSASDSDSMQVNVPWRSSSRFTPPGVSLESLYDRDNEGEDTSLLPYDGSRERKDSHVSTLEMRAIEEEERERQKQLNPQTPTSTSSDRHNSVDSNMSDGSDTSPSLSSFSRLRLRLGQGVPFLPLIEESSPLDTDSIWARFRRGSSQSVLSHISQRTRPKSHRSPLSGTPRRTSTSQSVGPSPVDPLPMPPIGEPTSTNSNAISDIHAQPTPADVLIPRSESPQPLEKQPSQPESNGIPTTDSIPNQLPPHTRPLPIPRPSKSLEEKTDPPASSSSSSSARPKHVPFTDPWLPLNVSPKKASHPPPEEHNPNFNLTPPVTTVPVPKLSPPYSIITHSADDPVTSFNSPGPSASTSTSSFQHQLNAFPPPPSTSPPSNAVPSPPSNGYPSPPRNALPSPPRNALPSPPRNALPSPPRSAFLPPPSSVFPSPPPSVRRPPRALPARPLPPAPSYLPPQPPTGSPPMPQFVFMQHPYPPTRTEGHRRNITAPNEHEQYVRAAGHRVTQSSS